MHIRCKSLLVAAGLTLGFWGMALDSRAASVELEGFGGWRFGGSFHDATGQSHTAEPSGSWGGVIDIFYSPNAALEILVSRQETSFRVNDVSSARINMTLDHYQIGGLREYGEERFRPFLAGLVGWSHVDLGTGSTDRFSVTLGGGAKIYLTPRFGFRGDLRSHLIFGNTSVAASSGSGGGSISFAGEVFAQGEVAGGIFLAFGGARDVSNTPGPQDQFRRRQSIGASAPPF